MDACCKNETAARTCMMVGSFPILGKSGYTLLVKLHAKMDYSPDLGKGLEIQSISKLG